MHTLLTWLGKTDLDMSRDDQEAAIATIVLKNPEPFDKVVILANTWDSEWDNYIDWLQTRLISSKRPYQDVTIQKARIKSPIDYETILAESKKWVNQLAAQSKTLTISLTSGTPAMISIAVILGKAKSNVEFVQSSEKFPIIKPVIPVNFAKEYVKSAAKGTADKALRNTQEVKKLDDIIAKSPKMSELINKARRLAKSEMPVLVLGETGTGKEVLSKAIHLDSLRADKPFKAINCGALPQTLVDSILFGHEKGAFTGADKQYKGLFEQAHEGTLFLDEVGELSLDVQVKLLRVLQEGCVTRVGGNDDIFVDVRIVAATHREMLEMVNGGEFREDLFYRLAIGILNIPPLRERMEDISELVHELSDDINDTNSPQVDNNRNKISNKGIKFIASQRWHGNIRELQNTISRAFLWSHSPEVDENNIEDAMILRTSKEPESSVTMALGDVVDINELIDKYKKKYILAALKATGNNLTKASAMLSLNSPQALKVWMKNVGVKSSQ